MHLPPRRKPPPLLRTRGFPRPRPFRSADAEVRGVRADFRAHGLVFDGNGQWIDARGVCILPDAASQEQAHPRTAVGAPGVVRLARVLARRTPNGEWPGGLAALRTLYRIDEAALPAIRRGRALASSFRPTAAQEK
jgi:hypothetical protein